MRGPNVIRFDSCINCIEEKSIGRHENAGAGGADAVVIFLMSAVLEAGPGRTTSKNCAPVNSSLFTSNLINNRLFEKWARATQTEQTAVLNCFTRYL
jgi:hypothetical protein